MLLKTTDDGKVVESVNFIESLGCTTFDGDNGDNGDDVNGDNSGGDDGDDDYGYTIT